MTRLLPSWLCVVTTNDGHQASLQKAKRRPGRLQEISDNDDDRPQSDENGRVRQHITRMSTGARTNTGRDENGSATSSPMHTTWLDRAGTPSANDQRTLSFHGNSAQRKKNQSISVFFSCKSGNDKRRGGVRQNFPQAEGCGKDQFEYFVKQDPVLVIWNGCHQTVVHHEHKAIDESDLRKK